MQGMPSCSHRLAEVHGGGAHTCTVLDAASVLLLKPLTPSPTKPVTSTEACTVFSPQVYSFSTTPHIDLSW